MYIRCFQEADAAAVSALITRTLLETNIRDYERDYLLDFARGMSPEKVIRKASWTHFYVACEGDMLIGSGAIGPVHDCTEEMCLYSLFILPEYQGKGVGKAMLQALETDDSFRQARRVEVSASKTAHLFYQKMGYAYVGGSPQLLDDDHYFMEKFPQNKAAL